MRAPEDYGQNDRKNHRKQVAANRGIQIVIIHFVIERPFLFPYLGIGTGRVFYILTPPRCMRVLRCMG